MHDKANENVCYFYICLTKASHIIFFFPPLELFQILNFLVRKDSSDSKAPPSKKVTSEVKKEKHRCAEISAEPMKMLSFSQNSVQISQVYFLFSGRKDPSDLKPCHPAKGHSTELKHIRSGTYLDVFVFNKETTLKQSIKRNPGLL